MLIRQYREYCGFLADSRNDDVLRVKPAKSFLLVCEWGLNQRRRDRANCGFAYRDRKAPRMAARRKSRRMREIARWQDACFGA